MVIHVISSKNLATPSANELLDFTETICGQNNVKGATNFVQLCVIMSRFRVMNYRRDY